MTRPMGECYRGKDTQLDKAVEVLLAQIPVVGVRHGSDTGLLTV